MRKVIVCIVLMLYLTGCMTMKRESGITSGEKMKISVLDEQCKPVNRVMLDDKIHISIEDDMYKTGDKHRVRIFVSRYVEKNKNSSSIEVVEKINEKHGYFDEDIFYIVSDAGKIEFDWTVFYPMKKYEMKSMTSLLPYFSVEIDGKMYFCEIPVYGKCRCTMQDELLGLLKNTKFNIWYYDGTYETIVTDDKGILVKDWIEFQNVSFNYVDEDPPVENYYE